MLRYIISRQLRISKNLKETRWTLCYRLFWALIYYCKGVIIGLDGMRRPRLGSHIKYDGEYGIIVNWANGPSTQISIGTRNLRVPYQELVPVRSLREFGHRYKMMNSW